MFNRAYVEITDVCNLACSFCPGTRRPAGYMRPEDFRLLAEDAPFFLLKLRYEGDTLVEAALNGAPVAL